ncbi:MAG: phosphatase PAP2 family protein [Methanobacteriaceae archaeon]|nr:phosphatase PAP2 family protein [Methanobacteriaceae archaeon]
MKLFTFEKKHKIWLLILGSILVIISIILYFNPDLEYSVLLYFSTLITNPTYHFLWYLYTRYALYFVGIPLLFLYFISYKVSVLKPYRLVILLVIMTSAIGNPIIYPILKDLISRPRPWVTYPDIPSYYHPSGLSFPSEHSFQIFVLTLPFIICFLTNDDYFKRNKKKIIVSVLLIILAITLAFSRLITGVHYLSDILSGIGLAFIFFVLIASLLQWMLKKGLIDTRNEKYYGILFVALLVIYMIFIH